MHYLGADYYALGGERDEVTMKRGRSDHEKALASLGRLCEVGTNRPVAAQQIPFIVTQLEKRAHELQDAPSKKNDIQAAQHKIAIKALRKQHRRFMTNYNAAFQRKYGRPLDAVSQEARTGDNNRLCQLIEWDKAFLFEGWVRARILAAQEADNRSFFQALGSAVRKLTGFHRRVDPKYRPLAQMIEQLRYQFGFLDFTKPRSINAFRHWLKDIVNKQIKQAESDKNDSLATSLHQDLNLLDDDPNFRRFIKSLNLI